VNKIWLLLLLLSSCVEYRLPIAEDRPDKYFGWANTPPNLDPKVGPKAKIYLTDHGDFRPYIGGHIIHQEELLLGFGVIYYASDKKSFEIGIRDSIYKTEKFSDKLEKDSVNYSSWEEQNPILFIGGVVRW